jgi:hypothetical protein
MTIGWEWWVAENSEWERNWRREIEESISADERLKLHVFQRQYGNEGESGENEGKWRNKVLSLLDWNFGNYTCSKKFKNNLRIHHNFQFKAINWLT